MRLTKLSPRSTREKNVPMSKLDQYFLQGVLCALTYINDTVIFDTVARHCGVGPLLAEAKRSGDMRRSGMAKYLRRHPEVTRG